MVEDTARWIKALADPVRLRLLALLSPDAEVCVCHLHEALALPQPTVSRHLAYLRRSGLVAGRRAGTWVYYRIAPQQSDLRRLLLDEIRAGIAESEPTRRDRARLAALADPPCA